MTPEALKLLLDERDAAYERSRELSDMVRGCDARIQALNEQIAAIVGKWKKGDRVVVEHRGKIRQYEIVAVTLTGSRDNISALYHGLPLTKAGTVAKNRSWPDYLHPENILTGKEG